MVEYQPSNGSGHENIWDIWIDCNTNIVYTYHILWLRDLRFWFLLFSKSSVQFIWWRAYVNKKKGKANRFLF